MNKCEPEAPALCDNSCKFLLKLTTWRVDTDFMRKQPRPRWFETSSRSLLCHCNAVWSNIVLITVMSGYEIVPMVNAQSSLYHAHHIFTGLFLFCPSAHLKAMVHRCRLICQTLNIYGKLPCSTCNYLVCAIQTRFPQILTPDIP